MSISKPLSNSWNFIKKRPEVLLPGLLAGFINTLVFILSLSIISKFYTAIINNPMIFWSVVNSDEIAFLAALMFIDFLTMFFSGLWIVSIATDKNKPIFYTFKRSIRKFPVALVAAILLYFIFAFGLIIFIIPGIYLIVRLLFINQAIVIDNKDVFSSLNTSWNLTENKWWNTFFFILVLGIIAFAAHTPHLLIDFLPLKGVYTFLVTTFIFTFSNLALTFYYLELRKRK